MRGLRSGGSAAEKVFLAEFDAVVAQYVVRRRVHEKIEIREKPS